MPQTTSKTKGGKGGKVNSNFLHKTSCLYDFFPRRRQLPVVQQKEGSKQGNVGEQLRRSSANKMHSSEGGKRRKSEIFEYLAHKDKMETLLIQ